MDLKLQNKKVLITGSTKGIGLTAAKLFLKEGAEVIINGRSQASVDRALKELSTEYEKEKFSGIPANMAEAAEVRQLIEKSGAVDVLINNAGIYEPTEFGKITDEDWLRVFNINVMGAVRLSRALLPRMLKNNWGRIIFTSAEIALKVPTTGIHCSVAKASLLVMAKGLSEMTKGTEVTVNSVMPGPTRTSMFTNVIERSGRSFEEFSNFFFKKASPESLLQRFAEPEEVAQLILYLASPLSAATRGAAIPVDGGLIKTI